MISESGILTDTLYRTMDFPVASASIAVLLPGENHITKKSKSKNSIQVIKLTSASQVYEEFLAFSRTCRILGRFWDIFLDLAIKRIHSNKWCAEIKKIKKEEVGFPLLLTGLACRISLACMAMASSICVISNSTVLTRSSTSGVLTKRTNLIGRVIEFSVFLGTAIQKFWN